MGIPLALTAGFLSYLARGRAIWSAPSRARLALVLWPFTAWWTAALIFLLALPATLAVGLVLHSVFHIDPKATLIGTLALLPIATASTLSQRPRIRRHEVFVDALPAAFEGYRIAQISDLHCGPFAGRDRVRRWVETVNRLNPDLVAVTGDLIASGSTHVPVVAEALSELRARDGTYACMGNHDYFTDGESMVSALEHAGIVVLRNRGVSVERDNHRLYLAGVDDTWTRREDLRRALAGRLNSAPVVLLAHDPGLFPDAARAGVDLTLSGHTHGGQLAFPLFPRRLNLARLISPYSAGLYVKGAATLYVNRGLGTTGPPVRLAVPPEIALITLRRRPTSAAPSIHPVPTAAAS